MRETDEPVPACSRRGPTIWYKVRLARTATVVVDTLLTGIDTWIQVLHGSSLAGLTVDACDDDIDGRGNGAQSRIGFRAVAGQTYYVQVGGRSGQHGDLAVRFRKGTAPANDAIANAAALPLTNQPKDARTVGATTQSGEPLTCGGSRTDATVWYTFTPDTDGTVRINPRGSDFSAAIQVYSGGPALASLVSAGDCAKDAPLDVTVTAGTQYWVQVGGVDGQNGDLHIRAGVIV